MRNEASIQGCRFGKRFHDIASSKCQPIFIIEYSIKSLMRVCNQLNSSYMVMHWGIYS